MRKNHDNEGDRMLLPKTSAYRIYWLGKWLERAENIARLMDSVYFKVSDESTLGDSADWMPIVKALGAESNLNEVTGKDPSMVSPKEIVKILAFGKTSSSILNCLKIAKVNAQSVAQKSLFVQVNKAFEYLHNVDPQGITSMYELHEVLTNVISDCMSITEEVGREWF